MKDLFWKIMAVIFILWLFLILFVSSIHVERVSNSVFKVNKITGKAYLLSKSSGWREIKPE